MRPITDAMSSPQADWAHQLTPLDSRRTVPADDETTQ